MKRSHSNPTALTKRRSFRGWLKRVTLPNSNQRKVGPEEEMPKGGVFGIPLVMSIKYAKTAVAYFDDNGLKHSKAAAIPIIVAKCGSHLKKNGLETEGIFRISGSVRRVNTLEFQFDQSATSYGLDLNWEGYTAHDAASLLRRYLNKLPDPVIPFNFYQPFRDVMNNNNYRDTEQRIEVFQRLIQSLPPPHQHLLLYLLDTLSLFASAAAETKMDIPNLAAVFCPGILRHPEHNTPLQYKISQYVIEFLVEFQSLFTLQLLVPTNKRNKSSTTYSSSSGEVPPVPLPLPSSSAKYHQQAFIATSNLSPPPIPLHVVNPSSPSIQSSSLSTSMDNNKSGSSFTESPLDIHQQKQTTATVYRGLAASSTSVTTAIAASSTKESVMQLLHKLTKISTPYYRLMRRQITQVRHATIQPWIGMAKPIALLICVSVLMITLIVIVYEAYLAFTLVSFEPLAFFSGLISYWVLLYRGVFSYSSVTTVLPPIASEEKDELVDDGQKTPTQDDQQQQEENMFPDMDAVEEKAMMQDENLMSNWGDLLRRAWKVTAGERDGTTTSSSAVPIFAADSDSIMSRSSRFNEEDFAATGSISSSDDDDEELGYDVETLDMLLSQYDQIKRDAEFAKQLQSEEQKARDSNNPFVVEGLAVGRSSKKPAAIDTSSKQQSVVITADKDIMDDDEENVTTPTTADKEEWKIKVFPRQQQPQ